MDVRHIFPRKASTTSHRICLPREEPTPLSEEGFHGVYSLSLSLEKHFTGGMFTVGLKLRIVTGHSCVYFCCRSLLLWLILVCEPSLALNTRHHRRISQSRDFQFYRSSFVEYNRATYSQLPFHVSVILSVLPSLILSLFFSLQILIVLDERRRRG